MTTLSDPDISIPNAENGIRCLAETISQPNPPLAPARIGGKNLKLSREVREYCKREGLTKSLQEIWSLAKECFQIEDAPSVKVDVDPDDGDVCVLLFVPVSGSIDEIFEANEDYIRKATGRFNASVLSRICLLHKIKTTS